MTTAAEIVRAHRHVLLDFDGPVCGVFKNVGDHAVSDQLRQLLHGPIPDAIATAHDPFDVLRYSTQEGAGVQARVEGELCRLEVAAVHDAPDTSGTNEVLSYLHQAGHTVTIVSNNSASAINTYIRSRQLASYVQNVSARQPGQPLRLKPHPHLIHEAVETFHAHPAQCVMIGDSVADLRAAQHARTPVIALANKPDKRERFEAHQPDAIIDHMRELIA